VARLDDRSPLSADGDWFVDTRCINCAASRNVAPGLLVEKGGGSVFARQPAGAEEVHMAWLAAEVCPTRSVGTASRLRPPPGIYPHEVEPDVFLCGYNARSSFGAHSWFVRRSRGNLLVDSPRYTRRLVESFEAAGGIDTILLSHRDDVADADQWADHFDASVVIHADDAAAAPYATHRVAGLDPAEVAPGVVAVPVPGHTKGSVVYLTEQGRLFTGDSRYWNEPGAELGAFAEACWYSWDSQRESLRRLASHPFERVFAGHGMWSPQLPASDMARLLLELVDRM
jgi:glyoxylase-like metal-dependent hydrolase (beta-lactamase superfamily II)